MLCALQYLFFPHSSLPHMFHTARLNFTITHPTSSIYALAIASHANKTHLNDRIDKVRGSGRSQIEVPFISEKEIQQLPRTAD